MRPAVLVSSALLLPVLALPGAQAADRPQHTITIEGTGVSTWPAYDQDVARFAIDTTDDSDGTVLVTATSTDPEATVRVNGRAAVPGDPFEVDGLQAGDEVAVGITDADGTADQSFVYLPPAFPVITEHGADQGLDPMWVGLSSFLGNTSFEAVLDEHGVPLHVREAGQPNDFTAQPHGPVSSVFEPAGGPDEFGYTLREYDDRYRLVRTRRITPVPALGVTADATDFHDVQFPSDDRVVLVGYNGDTRSNGDHWIDAVVQVTDSAGTPVMTWTSKDEVDPATEGRVFGGDDAGDYAHINSVDMLPGGDIVASFRNLGQVMRINPAGQVVWRLGGLRNDFTFVDDPYNGFCAQHDVRVLPNGHLLVFDNGSRHDTTGPIAPQTADMCPDPAGGDGLVARPQTRIAEYALDTDAMTATLVWSFVPPRGRYAPFAGSALRLADGTTLVGWSRSEDSDDTVPPLASLVTPGGEEPWSLTTTGWFSYRVRTAPAPDAIPARAHVTVPTEGAVYRRDSVVVPDVGCSDQGGSGLTGCDYPGAVDTATLGDHTFTVVAGDAAGNIRTRTIHYRVARNFEPRAQARKGDGPWRDRITLRPQRSASALVRVVNDGLRADRFTITGTAGNADFRVKYAVGERLVTWRTTHDGLVSAVLQPGEAFELTVVATRKDGLHKLPLRVHATSEGGGSGDTAKIRLK